MGKWLQAVLWYATNFHVVKHAVESFKDDGCLVQRAKEIDNDHEVTHQLVNICQTETVTLSMTSAKYMLEQLTFQPDLCSITSYIQSRVSGSDFEAIFKCNQESISPFLYQLLHSAQSTSCSVERSFSTLKSMLRSNRQFKGENVEKYLRLSMNL